MKTINQMLKIKVGEGKRTFYFTLYFFFLISSLIISKTARDTFFLSRYNPDFLPYMFMIVAVVIAITVAVYVRFSKRFPQIPLIIVTGALFMGSLIVLQAVLTSWVYPFLYVWIEIIGTIMIPQCWLLANRAFDTREAKRLFGIIGAGGAIANSLIGFSIRPFVRQFGTDYLLLISAMFIGLTILAVLKIQTLLPTEERTFTPELTIKSHSLKRKNTSKLLSSGYLKTITVVVAVAAIVGAFIDYQLKIIASRTLSEAEIASMFGILYGIVGIASIFMQFFITGRILTKFGILVGLILLPSALILGSALIFLSPVILFALIARIGDFIFRYTINDISSQLLWLPISPVEKFRAKPFIDGTIKNGAQGASGLIILAVIGAFDIRILSLLAILLSIFWLLHVFKLKKGYLEELKKAISKRHLDFESLEVDITDPTIVETLRNTLEEGDDYQKLFILETLEHMSLTPWRQDIQKLFQDGSVLLQEKIFDMVGNDSTFISNEEIMALIEKDKNNITAKAILIAGQRGIPKALSKIDSFLSSTNPQKRAAAAAALLLYGKYKVKDAKNVINEMLDNGSDSTKLVVLKVVGNLPSVVTDKNLKELLIDESIEVRQRAIELVAYRKDSSFIPLVVKSLTTPATALVARQTLKHWNADQVLTQLLTQLTHQSLQKETAGTLIHCLRDYAHETTFNTLMNIWKDANEENRNKIADTLFNLTRSIPVPKKDLIKSGQLVEEVLHTCYHYFNALYTFKDNEYTYLIKDFITTRIQKIKMTIIKLSLLPYPDSSIENFAHIIKTPNSPVMANVLEFLDNTLPKETREKILPVLDNSPLEEKLEIAKNIPHILFQSKEDLLLSWIHSSEPWISAISLNYVLSQERDGIDKTYILSSINWNNLITSNLHKEIIHAMKNVSRITNNKELQDYFQKNWVEEDSHMYTILDKTIFLKGVSLFQNIPGEEVSHVAQIAAEVTIQKGESIFHEGDMGDSMFIIVDGKVRIHKNDHEIASLSKGEFIGEMALLDQEPRSASATTVEETVLLRIDREDFYDLMASRMEIMQGIVKVLIGRLREAIA